MEIAFTHPIYLVLLVSIPFLVITHFFTYLHVRKRAMRFANFDAIRRVTGGDKKISANTVFISRNVPVLLVRICILLSLILSAASPVLWLTGSAADKAFVLSMDTSSSMLADDLTPTRLAAAKDAADTFVSQLPSQTTIGLVTFSGDTFIEQRPAPDKSAVRQKLTGITISRTGGTNLGGAIVDSVNLLSDLDKSRAIIILTDGRGNVGTDLDEAIAYARTNHVSIYTIGVGTAEGGTFLKTEAVSKLDEETLQRIATETGGGYYAARDAEGLATAFDEIAAAHLERIPLKLSMGLMLFSLVLIFVEWGLINTRYRTVP